VGVLQGKFMHKQKRSKWVKEKRQNYVLGEKEIFKKKSEW
jgi:hypothetical protein